MESISPVGVGEREQTTQIYGYILVIIWSFAFPSCWLREAIRPKEGVVETKIRELEDGAILFWYRVVGSEGESSPSIMSSEPFSASHSRLYLLSHFRSCLS